MHITQKVKQQHLPSFVCTFKFKLHKNSINFSLNYHLNLFQINIRKLPREYMTVKYSLLRSGFLNKYSKFHSCLKADILDKQDSTLFQSA